MEPSQELVCPPTPGKSFMIDDEMDLDLDSLFATADDDDAEEFQSAQRQPDGPNPRRILHRQKMKSGHIKLTPAAHSLVRRARQEIIRLAGLRNRVRRQTEKLRQSLERGEAPDWCKINKKIPTTPLDIPCSPETIVSWHKKTLECSVVLGGLLLREHQSKLATVEAEFQKAKATGISLIDAKIKDDAERRRAHRVWEIQRYVYY